jgi:hypothetical protein
MSNAGAFIAAMIFTRENDIKLVIYTALMHPPEIFLNYSTQKAILQFLSFMKILKKLFENKLLSSEQRKTNLHCKRQQFP